MLYTTLKERLNNQHTMLDHLLENISFETLNQQPIPGKWSVHQHIAHLAKYQPVFAERMQLILTDENPYFEPYRAETDEAFEVWTGWPTKKLLERLNEDRGRLYLRLSGLTGSQLDRRGRHPKYGNLTVLKWTEFFILHESHHLNTIFRLIHDTGQPVPGYKI